DLCTQVANNIPVPTLPRSLLDIQISSITPTFFWDKRDDIVDPHRGFFTSASASYAFPLFSAKSRFTKEFVQGAWYVPLTTRTVFAVSSRVGWIQPLGDTDSVPLSERFIGGGEASHRAFGLDLLGTLCEDRGVVPQARRPNCRETLYDLDPAPGHIRLAPLGGNGLLILNAEYRFPVFGPVGAAVFTDIGNVYKTSAIRFGDLRYGVGTGIRYLSPLGPLRFDVGYKLRRRVLGQTTEGKSIFEDPFAFHLNLGYAF
ncbi:MAG: BamA/TamA family outer membrane protein, partial [Thermoanaerobaculia bacterium]